MAESMFYVSDEDYDNIIIPFISGLEIKKNDSTNYLKAI